ncbi:hypothetical protein GCM10023178_67840 [Actinomadura luteofluorescens]
MSSADEVVVHETLPSRVLIGPGASDLVAGEVARIGAGRVLLVAAPSAAGPGPPDARASTETIACISRPPAGR